MQISVIVPTYRRAEDLERCLQGLRDQVRTADEICVIAQSEDEDTLTLLEGLREWPVLKTEICAVNGQVGQLNVGLSSVSGDIVAIIDDDAIPRKDWLLRIERHFAEDASLGGLGGRDFVHEGGVLLTGNARQIGVVQWFGRVIGNHHIGGRIRRNVDILKGANMAFRGVAIHGIRFDADLRGRGAQTCNDMAFSLSTRSRGWTLTYDPEVAVDHFPAPRHNVPRTDLSLQVIHDNCFNFYLALRRHMKPGWRRQAALGWALLIGTKEAPGLLRGMIASVTDAAGGKAMRRTALEAWASVKQLGTADRE